MDPNISRRKFMKLSTAAALASASGLGLKSPDARAFSASVAQLLVIDPVTLAYKIHGRCCHLCPSHVIVSHYQPVVLCEVIKGGGDTVLGNPVSGPLSVGVDKNDYTSMAVRLWEIPDWAVNVAMAGNGCKMCGVSMAKLSSVAHPTSGRHSALSGAGSGLCGSMTDTVMARGIHAINNALPSCFPRLLYTTETDPTWNTGCRDIAKASIIGPLCSSLASTFSLGGMETCIGTEWGPLYPRQMASQNDNAAIAAGIAAYRALHIARFAIGTLPFDASLAVGKLQQTSPHITMGFGAGSMMLNTAMRLGNVSLSEVYSFVWWVPVVCCKKWSDIWGYCTPSVPCL